MRGKPRIGWRAGTQSCCNTRVGVHPDPVRVDPVPGRDVSAPRGVFELLLKRGRVADAFAYWDDPGLTPQGAPPTGDRTAPGKRHACDPGGRVLRSPAGEPLREQAHAFDTERGRSDPEYTDVYVPPYSSRIEPWCGHRVSHITPGALMVLSACSDSTRRSGSAAVRPRRRLVALVAVAASAMMLPGALPADASSPSAAPAVLATPAASATRFGGPIPRLQRVAPAHRLIPRPASLKDLSGAGFRFGPETLVVVDGGPAAVRVARGVAQRLRRSTGFLLPVVEL
jgi:hypothetical protein